MRFYIFITQETTRSKKQSLFTHNNRKYESAFVLSNKQWTLSKCSCDNTAENLTDYFWWLVKVCVCVCVLWKPDPHRKVAILPHLCRFRLLDVTLRWWRFTSADLSVRGGQICLCKSPEGAPSPHCGGVASTLTTQEELCSEITPRYDHETIGRSDVRALLKNVWKLFSLTPEIWLYRLTLQTCGPAC